MTVNEEEGGGWRQRSGRVQAVADADGVLVGECTPSALESRAGVASLEALHTERRHLVREGARLMAMYGPFGLADDFRKRYLEVAKVKARAELTASDSRVTEAMVDARAYSSPEYEGWLERALAEKVEYLVLATRITEIEESVRSRELELTSYNRELALAR